MGIKNSIPRLDAVDKVTGAAKYTEDLIPINALVGKTLHSTIANGTVRAIDVDEAWKIPGVVDILTCFECRTGSMRPVDIRFPWIPHIPMWPTSEY